MGHHSDSSVKHFQEILSDDHQHVCSYCCPVCFKRSFKVSLPSLPLSNAPPPPPPLPPPPAARSPIVGAGDISIWDASASLFGLSGPDKDGRPAPARATKGLACGSANSRSAIGWWTCWLMAVSRETRACSWGAGVVGVTSPDGGAVRKPSETLGGSRHDTVPPWACSPSERFRETTGECAALLNSSSLSSALHIFSRYDKHLYCIELQPHRQPMSFVKKMSMASAEEGSKLYSYLLNGVNNPDPQQQHNLLPHHSPAICTTQDEHNRHVTPDNSGYSHGYMPMTTMHIWLL